MWDIGGGGDVGYRRIKKGSKKKKEQKIRSGKILQRKWDFGNEQSFCHSTQPGSPSEVVIGNFYKLNLC